MLFLTYKQTHWKKQGHWFYHTFVDLFLYIQFRNHLFQTIISHADNVRVFIKLLESKDGW